MSINADGGTGNADDSAVEYLYKEDQLLINDLDRIGRPASGLSGPRGPEVAATNG